MKLPTDSSLAAQAAVTTTPVRNIAIESMLESAMVLNWGDLMESSDEGLLHMEYRTGPEHFIQYLKVWSSASRGHWRLLCEYWTSDLWSHAVGLSFNNGHSTASFALMLEFVMQHQDAFLKVVQPGHDGIVQVYPPSEKEDVTAKRYMNQALQLIQGGDVADSRQDLQFRLEMLSAQTIQQSKAREAATDEGMPNGAEAHV